MSLGYAFFIDFESKMLSKKGPWEVFFSVSLISWFLKDVLDKILTFDSEIDPKIDAKRKNKWLKLEVQEQKAKMFQNGCQKGPRKLSKFKKNRYENRSKKVSLLFFKKIIPIPCSNRKTWHFAPYIFQF